MYMPWYVPEGQLAVQDNIALFGSIYHDCDANKFFDSMTTLLSQEGLSAAGTRLMVVREFEWKKYSKISDDPYSTSFVRQAAFGKVFSALTQYTIWESE